MARQYTNYDDPRGAGMIQRDEYVGEGLDYLDSKAVANNTIVVYVTDNGPEQSSHPWGGTTTFHSDKMTPWEGSVRSPGHIKPGTDLNGIQTTMDVFPRWRPRRASITRISGGSS